MCTCKLLLEFTVFDALSINTGHFGVSLLHFLAINSVFLIFDFVVFSAKHRTSNRLVHNNRLMIRKHTLHDPILKKNGTPSSLVNLDLSTARSFNIFSIYFIVENHIYFSVCFFLFPVIIVFRYTSKILQKKSHLK